MIQLTRLNKHPFVLNSDLIESIENAPDTVITLVTGEKLVVLETAEDILDRIVVFRRRLVPTSLASLPTSVLINTRENQSDESE
jgi:flagellar protein FlbD